MRTGEIIGGKYRLEERLGAGGHAQVWRATVLARGREVGVVAVKFFNDVENFEELELLQRLAHEHLIAFRGFEEHENRLCVVMEYAEGGSAEAMLKACPQGLPGDDLRPILAQICEGLAYLHAERVIHRDVKPANIVFAAGRAKLCDVGIARALDAGTSRFTGQLTIAYAAPELLGADPELTPAVDVYSLGVTAFELLTGRLPFGASPAEIVRGAASGAPTLAPGLPAPWPEFLRGCLAPAPADRWPLARAQAALVEVSAVGRVSGRDAAPIPPPVSPSPVPGQEVRADDPPGGTPRRLTPNSGGQAALVVKPVAIPACADCGQVNTPLLPCTYRDDTAHALQGGVCRVARCASCLDVHKAHHSVNAIAGLFGRLFGK